MNQAKHGIDFADVPVLFEGTMLTSLDVRQEYGDARWTALGWSRGRLLAIVFTEPRPGQIRIISARKATRQERAYYESQV